MIAFDSPDGVMLRALKPSRSAVLAIWQAALEEGSDGWSDWAEEILGGAVADGDLVALRFMQAVHAGDERKARQFWAVLSSLPSAPDESHIIKSARELRASLPF